MHKHSRASDSPQSFQSSQSSSDGVQSHFHFFVFTIQTHVILETIPETKKRTCWKRLAEWHWEDLSQWPLPAPFDQTPGSWTCVSGRDDEDVRRNRQPLAPNDRERRPFRGRLGIEFTNSAVLTLFIILGAANSRFSNMDAVVCRLYSISAKPFRIISQSDLKEELFSPLERSKRRRAASLITYAVYIRHMQRRLWLQTIGHRPASGPAVCHRGGKQSPAANTWEKKFIFHIQLILSNKKRIKRTPHRLEWAQNACFFWPMSCIIDNL